MRLIFVSYQKSQILNAIFLGMGLLIFEAIHSRAIGHGLVKFDSHTRPFALITQLTITKFTKFFILHPLGSTLETY